MADTKHDIGVYTDCTDPVDPAKGVLEATHANIASMALLDNQNGGSLTTADVAIIDSTNDEAVVEASSSNPYAPAFVVGEDIDSDGAGSTKTILDTESGWIYKPGAYVPAAAVDGAVAIGEYLKYSATAKKFNGTDITSRRPKEAQAIALAASVGAGNIPVMLLSPSGQKHIRARVYNDANIVVASGSWVAVTFNSETFDDYGMHDTGSNTERLTIPAGQNDATYKISASLTFNAAAMNHLIIRKNGTDTIASRWVTTGALYWTITAQDRLSAGDYVEVCVYSVSGVTVMRGSDYSPIFSITQIGE